MAVMAVLIWLVGISLVLDGKPGRGFLLCFAAPLCVLPTAWA